ncbi:hypothetical protein ORI20_03210 [Mycobacterium sp. CVI_P3]|uniref:Uncharacterized protein n=1 Tax=Mycobacterium pinniadriaticum TaxID=2994102 RepID=A0ABT3S980_9MYCO|nr:hypothetical protein [Mycobacterium pinniadriaticum]MCX2929269.1 hypothetical protein [Mycobacterium pinniadriaticum]MCX2935694.1 hypothetical protein [Mycobacterium pinniadriaticum]
MTQSNVPAGLLPEAVDLRRAAAVLLAADPVLINAEGIGDVITEVKHDLRITELVVAVSIVAHRITDIGTDDKQKQLWEEWAHFKAIEEQRKGTHR